MHKLSVYVETSVWSHAFAEDAPQLREATERFLDEARTGKYDLFISVVVFTEFARAKDELAVRLRSLVAELDPVVLDLNDEVDTACPSVSRTWCGSALKGRRCATRGRSHSKRSGRAG